MDPEDAQGMAALRASKKALRREITNALSQLSHEAVHEQSYKVASTLLNMHEYKTASRISVYLSMDGKELQTRRIVLDALDSGKKVFVPYIFKRSRDVGGPSPLMDMLALESHQDYNSLARDNWGIPSLSSESVAGRENCFGGLGLSREGVASSATSTPGEALDLIIVPGVAFDDKLGRLGHGKGYYDKFLSRCKELLEAGEIRRMPVLIALALDQQMLPKGVQVPSTASDWRVDGIVTVGGTFRP